jgi:hypothetical protein
MCIASSWLLTTASNVKHPEAEVQKSLSRNRDLLRWHFMRAGYMLSVQSSMSRLQFQFHDHVPLKFFLLSLGSCVWQDCLNTSMRCLLN